MWNVVVSGVAAGGNQDEHKENLFFAALTKFMRKSALSSLTEIER